MHKKRMMPLLIAIMTLVGCTQPAPAEAPPFVPVEMSLEPLLMPGESQPEILRTEEGVLFQWPSTQWVLIENKDGYQVVAMDGTHYLSVDPDRLHLTVEELSLETHLFQKTSFVKGGLLVTTKNQQGSYGVAHLREVTAAQLEWLIQNQQQPPSYLISDDGTKVAFMNPLTGTLSTYHTVTGRRTNINNLTEGAFTGDWTGQIQLSPLGGYLSYAQLDLETGLPIQFTIYGADSGRLIRDKLPGVESWWNRDDQQVVFLLNSINQKELETFSGQLSQGNQLGLYTLRSGQVNFLNRFADNMKLTAAPLFSKDNKYLVYAVGDREVLKIVTHSLEQRVQQAFTLPEGAAVVPGEHWASMDEETLVAAFEDESGYHLMVYHLTADYTEIIRSIDSWKDAAGKAQWFVHRHENEVIYLKNGWLMAGEKGNHRPLIKLPITMEWMAIRHSGHWLMITFNQGRGGQLLYFLPL